MFANIRMRAVMLSEVEASFSVNSYSMKGKQNIRALSLEEIKTFFTKNDDKSYKSNKRIA